LDAVLRKRPELWDCAVRCRHCGIRFFTHPRNRGRRDLRCPFGCRERHRRQRGNERSRKHYQTAEGRKNKKRLNGQRSKSARDAEDTFPREGDAPPSPVGRPALEKPADAPSVHVCSPESVSEPAEPEAIPLNGERSKSAQDAEDTSPREGDAPPSPVGRPALEKPAEAPSVHVWSPDSVSESAEPEAISRAPSGKATPPKDATFAWEGVVLDEPTLRNSPVLPYVLMVASVIEGRTIRREELLAALRKRMRQRSMGRRPRRQYVLHFLHQDPP
jgi:hypothetical protein